MNCDDHGPLLVAYLHDELTPVEQEQVQRHLSACSACRSRLDEYRQVRAALGQWEPIRPSPQAEARLFEQIHVLATERRRDVGLLEQIRDWWQRSIGRQPLIVGAAALVVVALAVSAVMPATFDQFPIRLSQSAERKVSLQQAVAAAGFPVLVPESLPPEVRFEEATLRPDPDGGKQVELQWKGSGEGKDAVRIVVRETPRPAGAPLAGERPGEEIPLRGRTAIVAREPYELRDEKTGATRMVTRTYLIWFEGDLQLVVEGHAVDEAELVAIAESLRPVRP